MAHHRAQPIFPAELDQHAFAAMTAAEFDTFVDLTEQLIAEAGPQATLADALQAVPELDPPF
ncbi:hypothetical protein [Pseudonocardia xishanensis]|uniref:Uncharacterized protein n=1 Tax=Pseudonocardia xishanensis TaxID=630995 RepID=A0ABP8S3A2_9PSEU